MGTVTGVVSTPVTWICVLFFAVFVYGFDFCGMRFSPSNPTFWEKTFCFTFFQASYDANPWWNGVFEKSLRDIVLFSHVPAHNGHHFP